MLYFYKTVAGNVSRLDTPEEGCWISAVSPNEAEIARLTGEFGLDAGFVRSSLDEEESSRVEIEERQTLIIVDYPIAETEDSNTILYSTLPMGIILTETHVVTICLRENVVLSEMAGGLVKNVQIHLRARFMFTILLRIATRYLQYLKQIDKISNNVEKLLHRSMKNKELIQLMDLQKSLVYFSTSLKSNETTLEKLLRGRVIRLYEEDQDLLEDVLIEVKQAIEMSNIYSSILTGTMDAFASIISNNVNNVMRILTVLTILMSVPNIVFSFYGMNVTGLPIPTTWFAVSIAVVAVLIIGLLLRNKNLMK